MYLKRFWLILLLLAVLAPSGCSSSKTPPIVQPPLIRVKLLTGLDSVLVTASAPPMVRAQSDAAARYMQFPPGQPVQVLLAADGFWRVGNVPAGSGELLVSPAEGTSVQINGQAYRGAYRMVPSGGGKFDVVNDVDLESYLKGVLSAELLKNWQIEAYKAQAIAARTYALYHAKTDGANRPFDVFADTRSQVYGGLAAETEKSRQATDETAGVVLAYGTTPGDEHIFETYFSSCCGGISQSAYDALNGPNIEPLGAKNVGALCNASGKFNWGPIIIPRPELTRRIKTWAARKENPIKEMGALDRIDIQFVNQFNRPIRFLLTDSRGTSYSLSSEQTRNACNTDAGDGPTLPSSFFKPVISQPDAIAFVEGHGFGHGVGLCQWCAEARAEQGATAEIILAGAFPKAKLKRAY